MYIHVTLNGEVFGLISEVMMDTSIDQLCTSQILQSDDVGIYIHTPSLAPNKASI